MKRRKERLLFQSLPQEIVEEIIKWLPAKSLIRFTCVCKRWYSLVFSDPEFNEAHLNYIKRSPWMHPERIWLGYFKSDMYMNLNAVDCDIKVGELGIGFSKNLISSTEVRILGSCNSFIFGSVGSAFKCFLWNPYTNSIKWLKEFEKKTRSNPVCSIFGLGNDHSIGDYKAIVIMKFHLDEEDLLWRYYRDHHFYISYIFSLRENSWKIIKKSNHFPYEFDKEIDCGTTVNGIPHWCVAERQVLEEEEEEEEEEYISSFDPVTDKFKKIPLPKELRDKKDFGMGMLQGCLCVIPKLSGEDQEAVDVWAMNVKKSWTKLYTLQLLDINSMMKLPSTFRPLGFSRRGELIVVVVNGSSCYELEYSCSYYELKYLSFEVRDGTGRCLRKVRGCFNRPTRCAPYAESLLCPWATNWEGQAN